MVFKSVCLPSSFWIHFFYKTCVLSSGILPTAVPISMDVKFPREFIQSVVLTLLGKAYHSSKPVFSWLAGFSLFFFWGKISV